MVTKGTKGTPSYKHSMGFQIGEIQRELNTWTWVVIGFNRVDALSTLTQSYALIIKVGQIQILVIKI